ncbi:MAG: pilus assembly protein TadG-related protein [Methylocystis sp.]
MKTNSSSNASADKRGSIFGRFAADKRGSFFKRFAADKRGSIFERFAADKRGSVAIVMGVSIIPLLLAAGVAADYGVTQSVKARLDAAADAAALAAIKTAESTIIGISASNPNYGPIAIAAGEAQGGQLFLAQAGRNGANLTATPTVTVDIVGQTVTATASYSASVKSNFGGLVGVDTLAVQGGATATLTMGKYLDFYLLLDVSASMGLPSTPAAQNQLAAINPDASGCFFACHFSGSQSYATARANNIQLRIDAVGAGVATLMTLAQATQTLPNQYRVGVYPFITDANTYVDLTSDLTGDAYSVATAINYDPVSGSTSFGALLDTGNDSVFASSFNPNYRVTSNSPPDTAFLGAGGTHIENIFNDINAKIVSVGDGSTATNTLPFVFFVSDGMEDSQYYVTATGAWPGVTPYPTPQGETVSIRAMDPSVCAALKARGVTVAVMQIPYPAFASPTNYANSEDFKVNDAQPNLSPAMEECASPGYFTMATSPQEITAGIQKLFLQAVQQARLSQ